MQHLSAESLATFEISCTSLGRNNEYSHMTMYTQHKHVCKYTILLHLINGEMIQIDKLLILHSQGTKISKTKYSLYKYVGGLR